VSRYQKGETNLDFTEARDNEWQWHQLGRMQVCTSLQTDNHTSTPPLSFFTSRMPFLPPNQQRQSTEGALFSTSNMEITTCCREQFNFELPSVIFARHTSLFLDKLRHCLFKKCYAYLFVVILRSYNFCLLKFIH